MQQYLQFLRVAPLLLASFSPLVLAQPASTTIIASEASPIISRIEPPQWWVNMPAAMLLVRGEHLKGSTFTSSDASVKIRSTTISENGHWAELQLSKSPAKLETLHITASNQRGKASKDFTFGRRRASNDGFAGFSSKDVMYLIMTDRFADGDLENDGPDHAAQLAAPRGWHGGDLRGVMEHLDYLQMLGITTVWITPVYQNHEAQSYHGYGATDLYSVDEHYGTLDDLQRLAGELHRRHMKLVLDTVPNHIGPAHPWVSDEPESEWFHGTKADHYKAVGEFAPLLDPHAAWRDQRDILDGWFANTLPDMNQENQDVAQYLTQNAIWWIEQTGADGLRIDTFPYVGRPFWHSFHATLHKLYPNLTTVGEVYNNNPVITSAFAGGVARNALNGSVDTGLTTPFDFPTFFALRDVLLHGKPMSYMADILRQDSLYPHPERLVPFLGNHDTKRFLGEDGATPDKLKLAFAILLTMRGMPQIYSGDEIAMVGGEDPDNRHDFPGGFGKTMQSAFVPDQRTAEQKDMYDWVQTLLRLRQQTPELNSGSEQILHSDESTLLYVRGTNLDTGCKTGVKTRVLIAVNKSDSTESLTLNTVNTALEGCKITRVDLGRLETGSPSAQGVLTLNIPSGASIISLR